MERIETFNVSVSNVSGKGFNCNFTAKIDRLFSISIADVDNGSLKSFHTLFDNVFGPHAGEFERNRMV